MRAWTPSNSTTWLRQGTRFPGPAGTFRTGDATNSVSAHRTQLGVGHDDQVYVTARGRFVHRLAVVPHARCQSVRVTQGPWQRFLGLASMHVDSVPGPVSIVALQRGAAEARQIALDQNGRALSALRAAGTGRWMAGGTAPDQEQQ